MDKQVKNASACSHYCLIASTTTIHTTLANVVARRCSTPGKILEAALESAVDLRRSKSADLYTTMTCDEAENQRPLAGQKRPNRPAMAEFRPDNKKAKIEVTLASSESGQLSQIESEFQILKSLIPDIANRQQINEVSLHKYK